MLVTQDQQNRLHSRPMAVNGEMEIEGDKVYIWFFTYASSDKVRDLASHGQQCNLSFSNPSKSSFLSLSGSAQLIRDKSIIQKRWNPALKAWFPNGTDEPDIALLRVSCERAEFWDAPSSLVAHAVSFVKGQVTGQVADPAEHRRVKMGAEGKQKEEGKMQATR